MKLTNKQKTIIRKSLKLNEDFFDDFGENNLTNDSVDDLIDEPDYTYNIQFIIYIYSFMKKVNFSAGDCVYYFEDPKYKPIIESGLLSMKKALNYILQVTSIVTDYSKPKLCSSSEKIIEVFPFMNNNPSVDLIHMFGDNSNNYFITLETSINLSRRKNTHNLTKLFYSFWHLQQIYEKLVNTIKPNIVRSSLPSIDIRVYKKNPYKKSILYELIPSNKELTSDGLELIKFLNDKDETDE